MSKLVGDQCDKCNLGKFDVVGFVEDLHVAARGGECLECPEEEHLHIACTKCGYMVWDYTAEQRQQRQEQEQR